MLSLTGEYALRAMVYLARHQQEGPIPGHRIAAELDIPRKYLSTILGDLVRTGVLQASPGRTGGFRFARNPASVRLADVVGPFEQAKGARNQCPFGNATCSDVEPCAGHDPWSHVKRAYERFLEETTILDVSQPARSARSKERSATGAGAAARGRPIGGGA